MKMVGKRGMSGKMFGVLLSLLFMGALAAQALFAADAFNADRHAKIGLACDSCHGVEKAAAGAKVGMDKCLGCHGPYDKLAKRTDSLILNWHANPHYGDLDCNDCHHGHKADENSCKKCHNR
jgi:hypothetical protein